MTAPSVDRPAFLYRLFDRDGELLYIGVAFDPKARLKQHKATKPWWPSVDPTRATVEWHPGRFKAEAAERAAIAAENPRFNIAETPAMAEVHRTRHRNGLTVDADRHRNVGVLARPSVQDAESAKQVLAEEGWTMNHFLIACLALLTKNPDAMLARLEEFKPPLRSGRPRKAKP